MPNLDAFFTLAGFGITPAIEISYSCDHGSRGASRFGP